MSGTILCGFVSSCTSFSTEGFTEGEDYKETMVNLSESNYKVIATRVKGEASGFNILSMIPTNFSLKKLNVTGAKNGFSILSTTEEEARKDMYSQCGNLSGRSVAFINLVKEEGGTNFFLFSFPKDRVIGDLIEFTK